MNGSLASKWMGRRGAGGSAQTEGAIMVELGKRNLGESSPSDAQAHGTEGEHHHRALALRQELTTGVADSSTRWSRFLGRIRLFKLKIGSKDAPPILSLSRTASELSDTQSEQFISFKNRLEKEKKKEFRVKLASVYPSFNVARD